MKRGDDMWCDTAKWTAAFLICVVFQFDPGGTVLAVTDPTEVSLHESTLLAKRGGKSRERYERLSPEEKAGLQKKLRQWRSLSPEEQQKMRRKMDRLNRMPPESQRLYQKRFKQWRELSPQERQRIKRQLKDWESLSGEEKRSIRGRFK
ncbi:hypothetical protein B2D07_01120 [Desulfococcus multivorans]|nr:hypothetical protein B2D07_01120 [Desulfococcus multivorans]